MSLLGAAFSTSFNRTLGQPEKVEKYLDQSRVYDHFVTYIAKQTSESEGDNHSGSVSLSDVAVQSAAKDAFPSDLIQKGVNTFIEANYAWLEGKTAKPEFKIDLSKQKETFAQKVGRIVKGYTATLPVCTRAQELKEKGIDPLAATCRPKDVTPAEAGAQTARRLSTTGDFLSNPVITAKAVNPKGNQDKEPYYEKLSHLPQTYRLGKKMPFILGVLSILFAASIVFMALTRRRGLRRVGLVLALAGAVLVAHKFMSDFLVDKVKAHVFNDSSVGELQRSLTDFFHRVVSSMAKTDLIFGIAFLILAAAILIGLFATRNKTPKPPKDETGAETPDEPAGGLPLLKARKRLMRPFGDSIMPLGARPGGPPEPEAPETPTKPEAEPEEPAAETPKPKPKRRKPRLIQ
jgi:hypothetical protein